MRTRVVMEITDRPGILYGCHQKVQNQVSKPYGPVGQCSKELVHA